MRLHRSQRACLAVISITTAFLLFAGHRAQGQDLDSDRWQLGVTPYFWFSGITGDVRVRDAEVDVDVGFNDIWDALDFGAQVHIEVQKGRWGLLLDPTFLAMTVDDEELDAVDADLEIDLWIVEFGGFYRIIDLRGDRGFPMSLDVLIGGRYWNMKTELDIGPLSRESETNWVDPFIGLRWIVRLSDRFWVLVRGDIGRLLEFLRNLGELDNTLIMVLSDNGASSEGGPTGMVNEALFFNNVQGSLEENLAALDKLGGPQVCNHYAWGWTWAGDTPFRRWKRETYRGGVSDPLIVHWPKGIKAKGQVRTQYAHAIDMVPTVLQALDIEPPETIRGVTQSPIEGLSFFHTFDEAKAPTRHITQYFEMFGHRSIYHDGWRAVCPWPGPSFAEAGKFFGEPLDAQTLTELDAKSWELYHIAEDFAENHNVAEQNRAKLIEMIGQWYVEAGKYNVLPIDSRGTQRLAEERPKIAADRAQFVLYPHTQNVPSNVVPSLLNRPHSITADVELPKGSGEGVLFSQGANDGGFSFYIQGGRLRYAYNYVGRSLYYIESTGPLPEGRHKLRFEFEVTGEPDIAKGKGAPGRGQLYIDGKLAGQGDIPLTNPLSLGLLSAMSCGADPGSPVTPKYQPPFACTARIYSVTVDVSGEMIRDTETEMRAVMARQ